MRNCVICGISIDHRNGNAITCSRICQKEKDRRVMRAYYVKNRTKILKKERQYRRRILASKEAEIMREYQRDYRLKNAQKISNQRKLARIRNRAAVQVLMEMNLI